MVQRLKSAQLKMKLFVAVIAPVLGTGAALADDYCDKVDSPGAGM